METSEADRDCTGRKCTGALRESVVLLIRNPELVKAVTAAGLLAAATVMSPIVPMVLVELRSDVWGHRMSEYTAMFNSANGIMAFFFSGYFGRLGDMLDRRVAMLAVGVLGFAPTWALLVCGQNTGGLVAFSVLSVFGGAACITVTGCPTCYALVNDVIPPGDREIAFGCCFASVVFIAVLSNFGGLLVNTLCREGHEAIIFYVLGLNFAFFAIISLVKLPTPDGRKAPVPEEEDCDSDVSTGSSSAADANFPQAKRPSFCTGFGPIDLFKQCPDLRYLCVVAALVSLPETTLTDVSAQYALNQFDLIYSSDGARKKEVAIVFQWPGYLFLMPAFLVAGFLAKTCGALRTLKILIPLTGVMMSMPVLVRFVPRIWLAAITGMAVPLSMVVFAPLQSLISEVAPPGKVGEAMGSVGASKQAVGLASNIAVSGLVPALLRTGFEKPLWIFYPLATLTSFAALAVAFQIKVPAQPAEEEVTRFDEEEDLT